METLTLPLEMVDPNTLKPHPQNYREHPEDQLDHICQNIKENGIYRNIAVAKDYTILAGHGVVLACRRLNISLVPVYRFLLDPMDPQALKLLVADNEIQHLGSIQDRQLTELLKVVRDERELLGTGYTDAMLTNLLFVSRPAEEIKDMNMAAHWVGMPDYDEGQEGYKLVLTCETEALRQEVLDKLAIEKVSGKNGKTWSSAYPPKERLDRKALRFEPESATNV